MCTNAENHHLNALHQCDGGDAPIVTLEYAAYMN